jgi:hypothetical protein
MVSYWISVNKAMSLFIVVHYPQPIVSELLAVGRFSPNYLRSKM